MNPKITFRRRLIQAAFRGSRSLIRPPFDDVVDQSHILHFDVKTMDLAPSVGAGSWSAGLNLKLALVKWELLFWSVE